MLFILIATISLNRASGRKEDLLFINNTCWRYFLYNITFVIYLILDPCCRKTCPSLCCLGCDLLTSSRLEFSLWWASIRSSIFPTNCWYSDSSNLKRKVCINKIDHLCKVLHIYFWLRFGLANAINDYLRLQIRVVILMYQLYEVIFIIYSTKVR